MPVSMEDLDRWPYLRGIKIPDINSDVGLIIGTNAPLASEPWEVVHSQDDGPYAAKTLLGWAVRGLSQTPDKHEGNYRLFRSMSGAIMAAFRRIQPLGRLTA